jgi:hypothetical protein
MIFKELTNTKKSMRNLGLLLLVRLMAVSCNRPADLLKIAGYTPEDLMEGVKAANKERFFGFTKGRIITLD